MSAELYALTHRGNRGDLEFYQRTCRGARSVLELGSGYGRVLTALAGAKRRVVGLERDREFLALARSRPGQLNCGSPGNRIRVQPLHNRSAKAGRRRTPKFSVLP